MAINHKTLADYEVATAAEAQSLFMDQAVIKVDTEAELASVPALVKTAYVLATGLHMGRDDLGNWKPLGGTAHVATTAPTNPQIGQLWINPNEPLPLPVRKYDGTDYTISSTTFANIGTATAVAVTRPVLCTIRLRAELNTKANGGSCNVHVAWTGPSPNTSTNFIGGVSGSLRQTFPAAGALGLTHELTFEMVLPVGTTSFTTQALTTVNTTANPQVLNHFFQVVPVNWADQYPAGVS